jgi:SAM-dependent methyltransferase
MDSNVVSVYYFQYKLVGDQRSLVGRLGEAEIGNLLPRVIRIATPEVYPPGAIVWYAGALEPTALEAAPWIAFLTRIDRLEWAEPPEPSEKQCETLRKDYDAFEAFLASADRKPIQSFDKAWVTQVMPQAFDYQSPARQSPYLIRAMFNLSYSGHPIHRVLDPMGGYGQTLFECVLRGVDGAALEISPAASRRSADNLRKLLRRLQTPFAESHEGNRHIFAVVFLGEIERSYQIINGDTRQARLCFADQQFDSLITDFPYGVRTGSRTDKLAPAEYDQLLDAALPAWKRLLKPKGTIVMAYNLYTLPRETVLALIEKHGLRLRFPGYDLSNHISDKIYRDIVTFELDAGLTGRL